MVDNNGNVNERLETVLLALSFLESTILKDGEVAKAIKESSEPEQLIIGLSAIVQMLLSEIKNKNGFTEEDFISMMRNKIFAITETS